MKYAFIQRQRSRWPVSVMCEVLGVSPGGYHQHFTRQALGVERSRLSDDALLERRFNVAAPDQAWAGDITYIATDEGWAYLAVVIDLFSRQVVGWSLGERMTHQLIMDALRMAWFRRCPDKRGGLIFHSDRGSQYCSSDFQGLLKGNGMRSSMSRKGDCWENKRSEVSSQCVQRNPVQLTQSGAAAWHAV